MNKYRAEWKEKNKSRAYSLYRDNHLKKNYGISLEQYLNILDEQKNSCAVCGKAAEDEGRALAVDHDHNTGEIFGLLCFVCNNKLIGKRRDPELFYKASEYLRQGKGFYVPDDKRKGRTRKRRK